MSSNRVAQFCREHGIRPPEIEIVDHAAIDKDGEAVFGRCFESGAIWLYRGSFQTLYERSLASSVVLMPSVLLSVVAEKVSNVLLHELYHWKQISEGEHNVLSAEEIEQEARQFSDANESQWEDLVILAEHQKT